MAPSVASQACRVCRYSVDGARVRERHGADTSMTDVLRENAPGNSLPARLYVTICYRSYRNSLFSQINYQCVRLHKACEYLDSMPSDTITGPQVAGRPNNLERLPYESQRLPTAEPVSPDTGFQLVPQGPSTPFPLAFFLDQGHLSPLATNALAKSHQPFVSHIALSCLGSDRLALCEKYFTSIDKWLPIISKKRIIHELRDGHTESGSCHELLLLCMKLCSTTPSSRPAESDLYLLTRSLCSTAESSGFICLQLIQCLILLTVFELSHAIHPAAYLTIGRATRLGLLMGLHERQPQPLFKRAETWSLREEQRRTWWAVFILERYCTHDITRII